MKGGGGVSLFPLTGFYQSRIVTGTASAPAQAPVLVGYSPLVLCVVPCLLKGGNKSSKNPHGGRHPPCEQEPYPDSPSPLPACPDPSSPPAPARLQRGRPRHPPPVPCPPGARRGPEPRSSVTAPTPRHPGIPPQLSAGAPRRADDLRRRRLQPRTVKTRGRKDTLDGTHGDRTAGK